MGTTGFFLTLTLVGAKVHVSSFTVGLIFRCFFPRDFNNVLTLNATLFLPVSTIVYHFLAALSGGSIGGAALHLSLLLDKKLCIDLSQSKARAEYFDIRCSWHWIAGTAEKRSKIKLEEKR